MPKKTISYQETGYFSNLICDYLDKHKSLKYFYNNFPELDRFLAQIEAKQQDISVSKSNRNVLATAIEKQYKSIQTSQQTLQNIEALKSNETFTITTGHQLNLFTGPLYFLYKIVSTINLTKILKEKYSNYNFVPIYWMATEDHDFEEINFFQFKGKKIRWNANETGAVGEFSTKGLDAVLEVFSKTLGIGKNAKALSDLFRDAYLKHENLAAATRYLANNLFQEYGLVIVDANTKSLKQLFAPYIKSELLHQTSYTTVSNSSKKISQLPENYKTQVNPREINLFYLNKNLRERIVLEAGIYKVLNTNISWTEAEILKEVQEAPERFSPNVIMRPMYQEVVLPNLCYIGGGGELAYWLQLKAYFEKEKVVFPILLLRNSVLLKTSKQSLKQEKLNLTNKDLFLKQEALIKKKTKELSVLPIDFTTQKKHLEKQFEELYILAKKTDKSFIGAVAAQEKKQINGLLNLEKRLLKAQKKKFASQLSQIKELQNQLFPNQNLQERQLNFSEFYLEYGEQLIPKLITALQPLQSEFKVLTIYN